VLQWQVTLGNVEEALKVRADFSGLT
jgi:hypothetical protein